VAREGDVRPLTLRRLVRRSPTLLHLLLPVRERVRRRARLVQWRLGRHAPYPPAIVKHRTIRDYASAHSLRVLVETGTYMGETVAALGRHFDRVYSIELGDDLHRRACARFRRAGNVELLQGDSGRVLPVLLERLDTPCLFWLDSHVSTERSAEGDAPSPVLRELVAILAHPVHGHVVLVDDARLLSGANGWPALAEIEQLVRERAPGRTVEVAEDIVRIT
jgi:hypothetical protein